MHFRNPEKSALNMKPQTKPEIKTLVIIASPGEIYVDDLYCFSGAGPVGPTVGGAGGQGPTIKEVD